MTRGKKSFFIKLDFTCSTELIKYLVSLCVRPCDSLCDADINLFTLGTDMMNEDLNESHSRDGDTEDRKDSQRCLSGKVSF